MRAALVLLVALAAEASADPCADILVDPIVTPLRDAAIDAQRGACLRNELRAHVGATALIDTPDFHGVIGGELRLVGRWHVAEALELGAQARLVRGTFAQTAVTTATELGVGPLALTGAWSGPLGGDAQLALVALVELPATRDGDTDRLAGDLEAVVTASLHRRAMLHARLGAIAMRAWSSGGTTDRLALRAGADGAVRVGRRFVVHAGADLQAGWFGGIDYVLPRLGVAIRLGARWRLTVAAGVPVGGADATTGVVDLALARIGG